MQVFGGSFIKSLARTAGLADENNLRKIKETWPEEWFKYSVLRKAFAEHQQSEQLP